jgi:hypothetical protein
MCTTVFKEVPLLNASCLIGRDEFALIRMDADIVDWSFKSGRCRDEEDHRGGLAEVLLYMRWIELVLMNGRGSLVQRTRAEEWPGAY